MTDGAGAIVLVAYGDIIINSVVVSNGRSNTSIAPTNGGNADYNNYNGNGSDGNGGDGGTGGCGGGAVTMIYVGKCETAGTISINGGSGGGYAKDGANAYDNAGILMIYGGVGGKGESESTGNIIKKQVLLS